MRIKFVVKIFSVFLFFALAFSLSSQTIPLYTVTICTDQSTGYYFMNSAKPGTMSTYSISHNMILDEKGNLLYFKKFTGDYKANDFKMQPNGLMSYFSNNKYYLMNMSFKIVDSVACKNGLTTVRQDMQVLKNGHYLVLGEEQPLIDLSNHKIFKPNNCAGSTAATVICGGFQELDQNKNVVFEWKSRDHFTFQDMDTFYFNDPKLLDWTHFNAIEQDADGNFLISSRNFGEITKISRADGSIMWRLGGNKNQFLFINDPKMFRTQHDVRRLSNGHITLFDNGRSEVPFHPAIAKEYKLDEKSKIATLVWSFTNDSTSNSSAGLGNVQRLANGNTLVNYGRSDKVATLFSMLFPSNEKYFEMFLTGGRLSYRVFNFTDISFKIKRPVIKSVKKDGQLFLDAGKGFKTYLWASGETTQIIRVKTPGAYKVFVPANDGGFISSLPFTVTEF